MTLVRGRDNILPRDLSLLQGRAGRARESGYVDPCGAMQALTGPRPTRVRDFVVTPRLEAVKPRPVVAPAKNDSTPAPVEPAPAPVEPAPVAVVPAPEAHAADILAFYEAQGAVEPASERAEAYLRRRIPMREVLALVGGASGIAVPAIIGPQRQSSIVRARQAAMFLGVVVSARSFPDCGRRIGGRDHTTVMHGYGQTCRRLGLPWLGGTSPAHVRAAWAMLNAMKTGGGLDEAMAAGAAAAQDFDGASERIENVERSRNWGKRTP